MKTSEMIALGIVAVSFIIAINLYPDMPEEMPSHWNAAGEVDGYLPRIWGLFLMPLIALGMLALFMALPRMTSLSMNIKSFRREYEIFVVVISGFMFYIYLLTLLWVLDLQFNMVHMIIPAFAVIFYCSGMLMPKTKRNNYIGIRTPWTLASDGVWEKTHKLGGKMFKLAGLVSLVGLLFDGYFAFLFLIVPVIIVVIYAMVYSYIEYKKERSKG